MGKYSEDIIDDVRTCVTDKKNPGKCIEKVLEEYDVNKSEKADVLTQLAKEELD